MKNRNKSALLVAVAAIAIFCVNPKSCAQSNWSANFNSSLDAVALIENSALKFREFNFDIGYKRLVFGGELLNLEQSDQFEDGIVVFNPGTANLYRLKAGYRHKGTSITAVGNWRKEQAREATYAGAELQFVALSGEKKRIFSNIFGSYSYAIWETAYEGAPELDKYLARIGLELGYRVGPAIFKGGMKIMLPDEIPVYTFGLQLALGRERSMCFWKHKEKQRINF